MAMPTSVLPGGPVDGGIDTQVLIDDLLPDLHADTRANLGPWSESDLIEWLDDAVKRLARTAGVFPGYSGAIITAASQPTYTLPADHIATLQVSYGVWSLRGASTMELEGMDPDYRTTAGAPHYWYEDLVGTATIGVTPVPIAQEFLPVLYEGFPASLDAAKTSTLVPAPAPMKAYLAFSVLAEAYGREGEMEAQDIAQHCRGRVQMIDEALQSYYGNGT